MHHSGSVTQKVKFYFASSQAVKSAITVANFSFSGAPPCAKSGLPPPLPPSSVARCLMMSPALIEAVKSFATDAIRLTLSPSTPAKY